MRITNIGAAVLMSVTASCGSGEAAHHPTAHEAQAREVAPPSPVREAQRNPIGLAFVYGAITSNVSTEHPIWLQVSGRTESPELIDLGRFVGGCEEAQYSSIYQRVAPAASPIMGTVCYEGGASIIAITRDADELVVSTADKGDGEVESGHAAMTPWREITRIRIPAGVDVRVERERAASATPGTSH